MVLRISSSVRLLCMLFAGMGATGSVAEAQQTGLQPDGCLLVSAAANSDIQRYVDQVSGRFGALAVSQDGGKSLQLERGGASRGGQQGTWNIHPRERDHGARRWEGLPVTLFGRHSRERPSGVRHSP
jgi:hypothetical protein